VSSNRVQIVRSPKTIRVAVNAVNVAPGGALSVLMGLLESWRDDYGHIYPTVFASRQSTIVALEKAGFGRMVVPVAATNTRARLMWQVSRLPVEVRRCGADMLLTTNAYMPRCPCPQVVHHQTLWSLFSRSWFPYLRRGPRRVIQTVAARQALRRADVNVFISEYMRHCAELIAPESVDRNRVIYNGIPPLFLNQPRASDTTEDRSTNLIAALQAPTGHKDNETLLRAFAHLRRVDAGRNWQLRIAGPGPWHPWKKLVAELGLDEGVRFEGFLPAREVVRLLRRSHCILYPSVFEGFGLPLIEAMACSCPVIAVNSTAIPEIAGDAAILVPPRAPEKMAEAVLQVTRDDTLRMDLINRAQKRAEAFTWRKSGSSFVSIFEDLCRRRTEVTTR